MKKLLLFSISVFICAFSTKAQITEYEFEYTWLGDPGCNPFSNSGNFSDPWKVSHGSPTCIDVYGQNKYNVAELVATYPFDEGIEKSEGLYISFSFNLHHGYSITVAAAQGTGAAVGMQVYAATGITENSNSDCEEDAVPSSITANEILNVDQVYDGPTGNFHTYTISEYVPDNRNYDQLWIKPSQLIYDYTGALNVSYITIEDLGADTEAPSVPTNLATTNIAKTSISVSWSASTDNLELAGYKVYKNGSFVKNITSTSYTFTGLAPCTSYNFEVKAYDTRNNISSAAKLTAATAGDFPATITLNSVLTEEVKYVAQATSYVILDPGFDFEALNSSYLFEALVSNECRTLSSTSAVELTQLSSEGEKTFTTKSALADVAGETYILNEGLKGDDKISLYPNPVTGLLNIDFYNNRAEGSVKIIDNTGKILIQNDISTSRLSIDVSSLPSGIYHVMITTLNNNIIKKIIKQ